MIPCAVPGVRFHGSRRTFCCSAARVAEGRSVEPWYSRDDRENKSDEPPRKIYLSRHCFLPCLPMNMNLHLNMN